MTNALILWGHALAALAFGLLAITIASRPRGAWPRLALTAALALTSLWALIVAGLDPNDITQPFAIALRNAGWYLLMGLAIRRDERTGIALAAVYVVAMGMTIATLVLAFVAAMPIDPVGVQAIGQARALCRMMETIAALVLLHHFHGHADRDARWLARPVALLLAALWSTDLIAIGVRYVTGAAPGGLIASRGFALALVAMLFGLLLHNGANRSLSVSRSLTVRLFAVLGFGGYAAATVLMTLLAGHVAGEHARIAQTAVICGSATALMTLLSTRWLQAWARVMLSKHFFDHRYDYRTEWQRFTRTLGMPGPDADPLDRRIVRAIAELTDSPAGLLFVAQPQGLEAQCGWNWQDDGSSDAALVRYLENTARIIELDAVREGAAPAEESAAVPEWMTARDETWVLMPLIHHATLVGAILLARPPVDRALDWEDLDLLRIVGRQAASYLAEERAHEALAEARRFDEFNRRFAFILHDIKNLVSGLTLVARNAERHADNPAFRADMIATLQESVTRMNALLARLSQHHQPSTEPTQPVDVAAMVDRIAVTRRAQHSIETAGDGIALAQAARLEQVLGHLVQNAIDASPADVPVAITVRTTGDALAIDIVDRGSGMSPTFVRDQLFRPFASSKPTGFGIGAYEARQLAEAMGGRIMVESREGEGTRFTVTLPLAAAMDAAA